jgi:hypothetical protein
MSLREIETIFPQNMLDNPEMEEESVLTNTPLHKFRERE